MSATSKSTALWLKKAAETAALLALVCAAGACAPRQAAHADTPPDPQEYAVERCMACHGASRPTDPWDVMAVYPDLPAGALASGEGLKAGFGDRLPIDSTALEWQVWQALVTDKGDETCLSCHLAKEPVGRKTAVGLPQGAVPEAGFEADPQIVDLHNWLHTPRKAAMEKTMGLWVDVDTYRTMLVATVKVLNYGAGHRAPTGTQGQNILLTVEGRDSQGQALEFVRGPTLSSLSGQALDGRPGFLYARVMADKEGNQGVPIQQATQVAFDSRLEAGEHDELHFYYMLPETAPKSGTAWKIEARLTWRSALSGQTVESVPMEYASALSN